MRSTSRSGVRHRARAVVTWVVPLAVPAGLSLWTANPLLTLTAFVVLAAIIALTWRPGEPPVLLFAAGYQWLQVSIKILHADVLKVDVASMFPHGAGVESLWLSLIGLVALSAGMRVALVRLPLSDSTVPRREAGGLSAQMLFMAFVVLFLAGTLGRTRALGAGGFAQILLAGFSLKWFFFFLLAFVVISRRRDYRLLLLAIVIEVVVGFTGFFSAFKEVFFVLLVTYLTVHPKFTTRTALRVAAFVAGLFALGTLWMAVRTDYRRVVSGGERAQVVRLEFLDRAQLMADMVLDVDVERLAVGAEQLAKRTAYVDFFSHVLFMVPRALPYENGALWRDAILHVLKPRLLFPNKPVLPSDSELTMKYAGMWLAGEQEGTSISMGYFAESYIDFGRVWMMAPIFLIGLTWGLMYRYFIRRRIPRLYAFAAAVTVLISANQFEIHNVKLVGGVLMGFVVTAAFIRWGLPRAHRYLRRPRARSQVSTGRVDGLSPEKG